MAWIIKPGQAKARTVYTTQGMPQRDPIHTVPLKTIEAPGWFNETKVRSEGVRWFKPLPKSQQRRSLLLRNR